ncbi:MAG: hypothetical protein IJB39_00265 [Alistipes sp.]|nr:hypothetical protein [Alistipes sp.]
MNKNIITKFLSLAAVALIGWGCETNYFNEQYLDGYEQDNTITDVQTINYTLSEDDYSAIANNKTNKDIAAAQGEDAVAALSAIGKNKYFGSADEAAAYIPAFVASAYPTVDDGSVVMVTYTTATEVPAELQKMNAATEYTLKDADYQTIWGSEEEFVKAITPATESKLLTVVPSEGLEAGDYVAVTYNYSAEEPYNPDEQPEEPGDEPGVPAEPTTFTSVLGAAVLNDAVEVVGYVSAVSSQGIILTDDAGSVLMYKTTGYELGDVLKVSGTISSYNKGFQIGTSGLTVEKIGTTEFVYPEAVELTGADLDAILTNRTYDDYLMYATVTGTLSVNGNYYNFNVDGATATQGSFYGLTDDQKTLLSDGETVTLYGYFSSISGGKFINFIATHINEAPTMAENVVYTSAFEGIAVDDAVEAYGYISAVSAQGPIFTDNSGSILLYKTSGYEVGDKVALSGTIGAYSKGFQIGTSGLVIEKVGTVKTTPYYGTPMELTGAVMDELLTTRTDNGLAIYASMAGTAVVGNYINFNVEGATATQGSIYGATDNVKEIVTDGLECTLYGYFCSISGGKYINMIVTGVDVGDGIVATRASIKIDASEKLYTYLKWNGSAFETTDVLAVQPADYTAMGQKYGNFTNPDQDTYLPQFLAQAFPYAQEGDVKNVAFRCYAGGATSWKVDEYVSNGQAWVKTIYFEDKTDQFRKAEGVWNIDRTLELDFTNTSSADTKAFYQYCVNWVYDNKDVPMGAPARDNAGVIVSTDIVTIDGAKPAGNYWVSNYGNNEFYTGASAYYGNMDWRPSAVKGGFAAAGLGDLSDDEILAALKQNTTEVFAEVLHYVYPTMTPEEYKKVVIKVYAYGPNKNYSFDFAVVGEGQFEYVADSITEL